VATAIGSERAMVGVSGHGLRDGVRRCRRARTADCGPSAGPRTARRLLFRHVTRQRRRPTGRRPVPAPVVAQPRWTLATDLAVRVLRARIRSSGHRRRLDGCVPCKASLRLQGRVQPVREDRLTTDKTIIQLYSIGNNRSTRQELKYFRIGFQLKLSQNQN